MFTSFSKLLSRRTKKKRFRWIIAATVVAGLAIAAFVVILQPAKIVALTFDDGPTPGYTEKVLDILKEKGVKATFFVTGKNAKASPDIIRRIAAEGHVVGNHSYSHISFDRLDEEGVFNELLGTQQVIRDITGKSPKFVRNPLGIETPGSQAATRRLGLTGHVHWHYAKNEIVNDDWTCKGIDSALNFAKEATKPGAILLAHDANEVTKCPA